MANEELPAILQQGVRAWNAWRQKQPSIVIDFRKIDLSQMDLEGFDFSRVGLREANLRRAHLSGVDLREADLTRADLSEANLSMANLKGARLWGTRLCGTNLCEADLGWTRLRGADLSGARLIRACLKGAHLRQARFITAELMGADLSETNLRGVNLSGVNLSGADFRQTNLIETDLSYATITDACLWETQRAGWTICGIRCEAAYWDKDWQARITYSPGEFERLYADHMKIVLHYEGGISPIEIATLPALIQRIETTHPGCVLRLQSVQEDAGGATVTLLVEDGGGRSPDEIGALKTDIEVLSQRAILYQRSFLEERGRREQIQWELDIVYNKILPRIMGHTMDKSQGIQINVSGGTIHGNIVGDVSGENAKVNYTHNDLAALEALVSEISAHSTELPLTSAERTQFEEKLNAIQEQLAAQAPNHSLLREALHTVRHILEAGVAHVLVGQWLPLLHKLG